MTTLTLQQTGPRALWAALLLLSGLQLLLAVPPLQAAENDSSAEPMANGNPIANYWRSVREGREGITTASGPYTSDVLIQNGGQNWRQIRNGLIANIGGWLLGIMLAVIAIFFAVRGRIRLEEEFSGKRVMRFTLWQRIVHWYTAVTFILLALSGLIIFFGRALLIPLMGKDAFALLADMSKVVHNFTGPLFVVAVLMLIVTFVAGNMLRRSDWRWFREGGGMRKGKHTSAGRYNIGEKLWFWLASIVGVLIAVTGVVLDFPGFGQTRELMQLSQIIHASTAMIFIAVAFGHIYIGTLGTEGAIEGMAKGHVDANWAKQHHDKWYEEMARSGMVKTEEEMKAAEQKDSHPGAVTE